MPGTGYPDYQRVSSEAGTVAYSITRTIFNSFASPILDSVGYGYVHLSISAAATTAVYWASITWFADKAGTITLESRAFNPPPGGALYRTFSVVSRYFQISINYIAGPQTDQVTVYALMGNNTPTEDQENMYLQPIVYFSGNVNAGATVTKEAAIVRHGLATVSYIDDTNNKWIGYVDWFDNVNNAWGSLHQFVGSDRGQTWAQQIHVPLTKVRMAMTNIDTVAHNFTVTMAI